MPKLKPGDIPLTEKKDEAIRAAIAADPDAIEMTKEMFENSFTEDELHPEFMKRWHKNRHNRKTFPNQYITILMDKDILDHFRSGGDGWEKRINDTLRQAVFGSKQVEE